MPYTLFIAPDGKKIYGKQGQIDPLEMKNLVDAPEHATIVAELRGRLLQWHIDCSGGYHDHERAGYWEDETRFYEPNVFRGERIARSTTKPPSW